MALDLLDPAVSGLSAVSDDARAIPPTPSHSTPGADVFCTSASLGPRAGVAPTRSIASARYHCGKSGVWLHVHARSSGPNTAHPVRTLGPPFAPKPSALCARRPRLRVFCLSAAAALGHRPCRGATLPAVAVRWRGATSRNELERPPCLQARFGRCATACGVTRLQPWSPHLCGVDDGAWQGRPAGVCVCVRADAVDTLIYAMGGTSVGRADVGSDAVVRRLGQG